MKLRAFFGALACRRGASAVETGFVLTLFLGLLFGVVNLGLVLWTQASLYYAVQQAARCASVNTSTCADQTAVQNYALSRYYGRSTGAINPFTYSDAGCGHTVNASYTYLLSIPFYGEYSLPLSATACFP